MKEISLLTVAEGDNTYHHANSNPGSASAHRRRTDLMPTITFSTASPAGYAGGAPGGGTGNGYSRSSTPGNRMLRSPGKAVSMSRLDTLSKPRNSRLQIHQTSVLHANSASANQNHLQPIIADLYQLSEHSTLLQMISQGGGMLLYILF